MRKKTKESFINVGSGVEKTIKGFAQYIMKRLNVNLNIKYDLTKPTQIPKRVVDVSKISDELNWTSKHSLRDGLQKTIQWYKENK